MVTSPPGADYGLAVRDDIYPLAGDERRAARREWRAHPAADRRAACRRAAQGLPADDPALSDAARRFGQYLLHDSRSNRMPRSALPIAGLLLAAVAAALGLGAPVLAPALIVLLLGLISWNQRKVGRLLVAANDGRPAP